MSNARAVTLKQLRALAAAVEAGSVTGAAERLSVTAPAVSTQLRLLESNIGARVLSRGDGRIAPTEAGLEILATTRRIETALENCFEKVRALRSGLEGRVCLGVVSTGKYFAPQLVAMARRVLPKIELALKIGNRGEIIEAVSEGGVDLAIMGRPPSKPAVCSHPLGDHPHVMIAAPEHPLAPVKAIRPEKFLEETFLMRENGSGTRILAERFLDRMAEGRPVDRMEFGSNETIKQAVIAGLGVALISEHTIGAELDSGRLVKLDAQGTPIIRRWFALYREDEPLSPAAERILAFLLDQRERFPPSLSHRPVLSDGAG